MIIIHHLCLFSRIRPQRSNCVAKYFVWIVSFACCPPKLLLPLFCNPIDCCINGPFPLWLPVGYKQWETLAGAGRAGGEWGRDDYSPSPHPVTWLGSSDCKGHCCPRFPLCPFRPSGGNDSLAPAGAWASLYSACTNPLSLPLWERATCFLPGPESLASFSYASFPPCPWVAPLFPLCVLGCSLPHLFPSPHGLGNYL